MPAYSFSSALVSYDQVTDAGIFEGNFDIVVVPPVNMTTASYTILTPPGPDNDLPEVDFTGIDEEDLWINGTQLSELDAVGTYFGEVVSAAGTSYVLVIEVYDPQLGDTVDYLSVLGGAPLSITSQASLDAVMNSITSISQATGAYAPNTAISLSSIPGVVETPGLILTGTTGNDELVGSYLGDVIDPVTNDNYDLIRPMAGDDTIILSHATAGAFFDLLYVDIPEAVTFSIDGGANTATVSAASGTDTIVDVATALNWDIGVSFYGGSQNDVFNYDGGVRETWANLRGGAGNDTFNVTLTGDMRISMNWNGITEATSGANVNLATGVVANDGFGGSDVINVVDGAGRLEITTTELTDSVVGSSRSDRFDLRGGNDVVDGGDGDDRVRYDNSRFDSVTVDLDAGFATGTYEGIGFTHSLTSIEDVRGSRYDDSLTGTNGSNYIQGRDGNDEVQALGGNDDVDGGDGDDQIYGGSGSDNLYGQDGDDRIYSGSGNDYVSGGDGDDYVRVGGGVENFDGGDGNDYISYYDSTNGITADLQANTISGSWAVNDTINSFESIAGSRTGDDVIYGTSGANTIRTYGGDDRVYSRGGTDKVELGSGDDYVRVGGGKEDFDGGSGTDYISYYDSSNGITANLAANTISGSWAVNDTINSFEGISGSRTGDDEITGTSGANIIRTYGGNDRVYAGGGTDKVELGSGNDYVRVGGGKESFDGGSGTDYISYYDSSNGITIDLAADTVSGSWAVNDTIKSFEGASGSGTGNDRMFGTSGANTLKGFGGDDKLYGRSGNDKLYGGNGEDRFDGGAGTDRLWGGADADVFHLDFGEGSDIIEDFENNVDEIQLDNFTFAPGEDAFDFAMQVGDDVIFDFGGGDGLTVRDTTIGQLLNDLVLV